MQENSPFSLQIIFIGWNLRRLLTLDLLAFSIYCVNTLGVETEKRERECVLLLSTETKQHHGKSLTCQNFWQRDHSSSTWKAKLFFPFHAAIGWKSRATFLTTQEKSYLLKHFRALRLLQTFALIFDWFNRLTSSIVIGWIKYFHFDFRKALWQNQMNRFSYYIQLQSRKE